ncbi:hypothetical protein COO60DRAFT_515540 [Scenedesmus sp. NREL 46B-D3]|nr:hypothetical protein COO60DRAFT_515540 [Scenedesmus sp. NREL 46B-D3]
MMPCTSCHGSSNSTAVIAISCDVTSPGVFDGMHQIHARTKATYRALAAEVVLQREWLEQQRKVQEVAASWPDHIFENFFVLGLPPDIELTQVAEQLCERERKQRHHHHNEADDDSEHGGKEQLQPPQPSFAPQVLFRYPPGSAAPISDEEVASLAFPSGAPAC